MPSAIQRRNFQNHNDIQSTKSGKTNETEADYKREKYSGASKLGVAGFFSFIITLAVFSYGKVFYKPIGLEVQTQSEDLVKSETKLNYFKYFMKNQSGSIQVADTSGFIGVVPDIPSIPRDQHDIHIIFSTDCSEYQNWQSLLLFYSAARAGQKGPVTRIASGCSESEISSLKEIYKLLPPHHSIHFTPDFSYDKLTGERYPYYNKPRGLQHFLENMNPPINETIIALLDPDMILLEPLKPFTHSSMNIYNKVLTPEYSNDVAWIIEGKPVGQYYGLGGIWADWEDLGQIVQDPASPALRVSRKDASDNFPVGPPYFGHVRDMQKLAGKWVEFVPHSFKGHPGILSEMYAFCIAAAHLELPHIVITDYMVSDAAASIEGWSKIEDLTDEDTCQAFIGKSSDESTQKKKIIDIIHYCHVFRVGVYMFGKRRGELHRIFSCDAPYLLEPPDYLASLRLKVHFSGKTENISRTASVRNAFILCAVTKLLNLALKDFREAACEPDKFIDGLEYSIQLTDLRPEVLEDEDKWRKVNAL